MGKVRILNTKTGEVKFVEEHIANDTNTIKRYGFIKQDLGVKEDVKGFDKKEISGVMEERLVDVGVEVLKDILVTANFEQVGDLLAAETPIELITLTELDPDKIIMLSAEKIREKYTALTGKKPGIKKPETLLKEIKELEN